jgi:hypothetical protein
MGPPRRAGRHGIEDRPAGAVAVPVRAPSLKAMRSRGAALYKHWLSGSHVSSAGRTRTQEGESGSEMSTTKLIRLSGLATLLAGALYALGALLHPVGEDLASVTNPSWVPSHLVYWVSAMLMLFGLVGLYARQAAKAGWLGLVGFLLALTGTAFVGSIFFMASTILPVVATGSSGIFDQVITPSTFVVLVVVVGFVLGYVLFGVATIRAGVFPRWSGPLLIIGVSLFMISEVSPVDLAISHLIATLGDVIFGIGLAWMGYALWSEKREPELLASGAR